MNVNIEIKDDVLNTEYKYTLQSLVRAVSDVFAVSKDDLLSQNRMAYIVTPRHVLYYMAYINTAHSTNTLGREVGRDHTTILYAVDKIRGQMLKNKALKTKITEIHLLAERYEDERQNHLGKLREEVEEMVYRINQEKLNGLRTT